MNISIKTQKLVASVLAGVLLLVVGIILFRNENKPVTAPIQNSDTPAVVTTTEEPAPQTENTEQAPAAEIQLEAPATTEQIDAVETVEVTPEPEQTPEPVAEVEATAPAVEATPVAVEPTPEPVEAAAEQQAPAAESAPAPSSTDDYNYTATKGDSYTKLARDAVQKYAEAQNKTLSATEVERAAAALAVAAGSPFLEIGQSVTITRSSVATAVNANETPVAATETPAASDANESTEATTTATATPVVAARGDSYTDFARKAVNDYAAAQKLNLNPAQRIAAETFISKAAGFPMLEIGQTVTISVDSVKTAVDAAENLTDAQLNLWLPYATTAGL